MAKRWRVGETRFLGLSGRRAWIAGLALFVLLVAVGVAAALVIRLPWVPVVAGIITFEILVTWPLVAATSAYGRQLADHEAEQPGAKERSRRP